MLDAPDLPVTAIADALDEAYGIVASVEFLPLGKDSAAWSYRADADDGASYFVKLRRLPVEAAVPLVPRALRDSGVPNVLAPFRTLAGAPYATTSGYGLVVYPYLAGSHTGMDVPLTDDQWRAFGATARGIHDATLPPDVLAAVPAETFRPKWAGVIRTWDAPRALDEFVTTAPARDDIAAAAADFWREQRATIRAVVDRAEELAAAAAGLDRPHVVCQADLHTNNVLVDERAELHVVDWDEVVRAPRERDLMFVVGGGISRELVSPEWEALFLDGYGDVAVDATTLAYYKHAWAVQDICEYGSQAFSRDDHGRASREDALRILRTLFAPDEIVALAAAADRT